VGIFGIGFDFFAEAADADVHATRGNEMFAAPDSGEKFLASEHAARSGSELMEEAEFEQAGGDDFVGAGDVAGVDADGAYVKFQDLAEYGVRLGAREEKIHAGDKFARAEGLGEVTVGAGFESGDEVEFAAAGGERG
jgi:hypothetical protein